MAAEKPWLSTGVCIECGQPADGRCYSNLGRAEFQLSGLCELCFDKITIQPEDDEDDQQEDMIEPQDPFDDRI